MQHTFPPNLHRSHWLSAHNLAPSCTIHSTRIHISSFASPVWEIIISIYPIITSLLSFPFFPFSFFFFLRIVFRFSKFFFLSFYTLRLSLLYLCFPVLFFILLRIISFPWVAPIFFSTSTSFFLHHSLLSINPYTYTFYRQGLRHLIEAKQRAGI